MTVIGRWKITAPRSPRRGENWRLECGALDGQVIPAGESVVVVPEQQLQGAVDALREVERICRVAGGERSSSPVVVQIVKAARTGLGGQ